MFRRLKHEVPNFQEKISMIPGCVDQPNFAMSDEDKQKIIDEVDIIYHSAATVRFDEKLSRAIKINTCGTREAVRLAKIVKNLKVSFLNKLARYSTEFLNFVFSPTKFAYFDRIFQMRQYAPRTSFFFGEEGDGLLRQTDSNL